MHIYKIILFLWILKKFHLKNANNSYVGSIEQSLAPLSLFLSERNKLHRGVILILRFPSFKNTIIF